MTGLASAVVALTGAAVVSSRALSGAVHLVELADGRSVVAKRGCGPDAAVAAVAEAAGLRWLAEVAPVPGVLGNDEEWLVLPYVRSGRSTVDVAEALGRALAGMHAAGAEHFGAPPPGGRAHAWIGLARMRNEPAREWPRWYAADRVEPYLRAAVDAGTLSGADAAPITEVCERITELAGPPEPPARLHGDLWSGNVLFGTDGARLIDPAAHGGHRETDLAMLHLFGCPHLQRIVAAYHEHTPLADGWRDRIPLHQLFPLLVHTVLFGGGYAAQAGTAARSALRA